MSEHFEGDLELADSLTMGFYKQSWTHLPRGKKRQTAGPGNNASHMEAR